MALLFTYFVVKMDGTKGKSFKSKTKAEEYARSLKQNVDEKIQITRTAPGMAAYVYYV